MKYTVALLLPSLLLACEATPDPMPPPAPVATAEAPPPVVEIAAPAPPVLTPEEKKKAADARELADDRAKWEVKQKAEVARWTPELHAQVKVIADKAYPSTK